MGGKSSAPPAPDYTGAAQQTAAGNLENLKYQTQANRPTQVTPWGTSSWTQNGDNNWVQTVSLSPSEQAALKSQQTIQQNQSGLAQQLQGQVASTMKGGLNAPSLSSFTSSVPSVQQGFNGFNGNSLPSVNTNFSGFDSSGTGHVNQQGFNPLMFTHGNQQVDQNFGTSSSPLATDSQDYTAGAGHVNLNAPQFNDGIRQKATKAAYNASTGLLQDQWTQQNKSLDENLRLQGLEPGTEAYNNAMQNQLRVQGQQQNQLANQAVLTGDQTANADYASALSGYTTGLGAQNQAFGQGMTTFNANNAANNQQFSNDLSAFNADNAARTQQLSNGLGIYSAALQGQQAQNTAQNQSYQQAFNTYQAQQQALQNANTAQGQAYGQALGNYTTGQQALQNANAAQQQQYNQSLGSYQAAYQAALQNYLQPLNSMNAVLTGQQVQNPTFGNFATAGYTPGADYTGATGALGQYNQGVYNAKQAAQGQTTSALAGMGTAAAALAMGF